MKPILIAYTTNAGSTEEVAKTVAAELGRDGSSVEVRRLEEVTDLAPYSAVVVGAPMILGWHGNALRFLRRNRKALQRMPVAYFATALSLTDVVPAKSGTDVALDPNLAKPPERAGRLSFRERYASVENYLRPMRRAAPDVRPVSVAFFGGKLELFRLPWWQALFVMVVVRAKPGDMRNRPFIREWASRINTRGLSSEGGPAAR